MEHGAGAMEKNLSYTLRSMHIVLSNVVFNR